MTCVLDPKSISHLVIQAPKSQLVIVLDAILRFFKKLDLTIMILTRQHYTEKEKIACAEREGESNF